MRFGARTDAERQDLLAGLVLTERARSQQFVTRILISVIGFAFLLPQLGIATSAAAVCVVLTGQIIDRGLKSVLLPPDRTKVLAPWELVAILLLNIQASLTYGAVPIIAWFTPEPGYKIFAGFWLSGSMLHVMLHMHHSRLAFFSSFIPHASLTLLLPVASVVIGRDLALMTTGALLFATSVFVAHFATAFRNYRARSHELREAKKLAEEQRRVAEEASEAKTNFLATLSHEIRTPMNGIIGMTAALEEADLPPDARRAVKIVSQSSELLLSLLNDVLDMSKIEAGRITLENEAFDLKAAAERVAGLHLAEAQRKGIDLSLEIASDLASERVGDEHRIVQVLHNLLGNAVKFTREGFVTLRVLSDPLTEDQVLIEVEDTGIGMTEDEAARVFDPFTQADSSTTRRFGGTGLGLTITRGLIEAMGGELSVRTEKGIGSTFSFVLPLPEAPAATAAAAPQAEAEASLEGMRILAIDDNQVNLSVLEQILSREGASTVSALSGEDGIELFEVGDFDIVLLDISMPRLDGPETLARMRDVAGARNMPPVIAVSAHAMPSDIEAFKAAGFDAYVTKPVRPQALAAAIDEAKSKNLLTSGVAF